MAYYHRVTYEDRCQIRAFLQVKIPIKELSQRLGFHKSSIYREIKRNSKSKTNYQAEQANKRANERKKSCKRPFRISDELEGQILSLLFSDLSPEQISARLALENVANISHQTIYNYIGRHWYVLKPYLRTFNRPGASRVVMARSKNTNKVSIDERPLAANFRERIGDWERDSMYAAKGNQILVCTDRKSRYLKLARIVDKKVIAVTRLTNKLLKKTNKKVYTITNDNGPEFGNAKGAIAPIYYCHPRKPQQRGTVENTIGLLRQYIKRSTDISNLTPKDIQNLENAINFRPRKCLDYKTPYEVFYGKPVALAV